MMGTLHSRQWTVPEDLRGRRSGGKRHIQRGLGSGTRKECPGRGLQTEVGGWGVQLRPRSFWNQRQEGPECESLFKFILRTHVTAAHCQLMQTPLPSSLLLCEKLQGLHIGSGHPPTFPSASQLSCRQWQRPRRPSSLQAHTQAQPLACRKPKIREESPFY